MKNLLLLVATVLLAACAGPKKDPNVNLAGYPPAFHAGYVDGCESSKRESSEIKDKARFKNDAQYASGWRDGYDICARRKK
jgi:hypothetical protein